MTTENKSVRININSVGTRRCLRNSFHCKEAVFRSSSDIYDGLRRIVVRGGKELKNNIKQYLVAEHGAVARKYIRYRFKQFFMPYYLENIRTLTLWPLD